LISYAYRARFASYGSDQINVILTLYLCIGNSGAYLSVDRLIKRFRIVKQRIRLGNGLWNLPQKTRATVATNIATRLIQFHYCVIYMAAGLGKLYGETWWNGTAMWRGVANAEYQTMDLTWLAFYPGVTEFLTHLTIAWEVSFCFLVWRPLARPWVLLIGAGMHLGIGMFLGMWTFGTRMIFGYLAYLGPGQLRELARNTRNILFNSDPKVLEVNSSLPHSVVSATWKKTFDIADRLVLVVDGSRPQDQAERKDRLGTASRVSRVIMLDLEGNLYQKFSFPMIQAGLQFNYVGTQEELHEAIEQFPESAVLVNLDGFSDSEVRNYFEATLSVSFKFYPCVTLIRNQQAHWLEDILLEDYQRILIQPCSAKDVLTELQRAFHFYDEQFPGIPRQISGISEAEEQPSDIQEPVNNVVDQLF
ncbi:MAG: hypothetical protein JKY95_12395, partial [Planctomycetaceae bacterium]|nr:hypothetical protein [Planctomycetaceae bacterium]